MENTKSYKGQTEGLIFFVLLSGSRHTDEIKELIDTHFTTVKLGTLYAQISKMTANKTIQEFRASSSDGSRRKYYKITPIGLKAYNKKYATLFEGVDMLEPSNYDFENTAFNNIATKRSKKKVSVPKQDSVEVKEDNYTALTHDVDGEIDFSMFDSVLNGTNTENIDNLDALPPIEVPENTIVNDNLGGLEEEFEEIDNSYVKNVVEPIKPTIEPPKPNNEPLEPMFSREEIEESAVQNAKNAQKGVDYDSFTNLQYEYNDVLNKIFPKPKETGMEVELKLEQAPKNGNKDAKQASDWSDIYEISEQDGLKIRTSSDTNRYRGSKISVTKLIFFTCLTLFGVAMLEFLLYNIIFKGQIEYSQSALITVASIFGTAVLVSLIAFILNPHYTKKDLPRFINSFEIALILAISTIIITFALTAIKGVDFYNLNEMFYSLILPATMAINAPIFVLIEYSLAKLEFFQTL